MQADILPLSTLLYVWVLHRNATVSPQAMAKQLHFNKNGEALKRMQAGVDKLASVVGVTLGPKVLAPFWSELHWSPLSEDICSIVLVKNW